MSLSMYLPWPTKNIVPGGRRCCNLPTSTAAKAVSLLTTPEGPAGSQSVTP